VNLFLDNSILSQSGEELYFLCKKKTCIYAGCGVLQTPIRFFKKEVMDLLRRPSKTNRIINSLWKNYSYYRKVTKETIEGIYEPDTRRNVTTIARELGIMERAAYEKGVFFGTSPVIYRSQSR
jgi:ActR/RegA family two-component response regulator